MSRRAQRPELEFGSDSFLDVVCNIVGILIILIVVVGVKVDRQPKAGAIVAEKQLEEKKARLAEQEALIASRQESLRQLSESDVQISKRLALLRTEDEETERQIQLTMESQELARQQLESEQEKADRLKKQASDADYDRKALAARVAALQKIIDDKSRDALRLGQALATTTIAEKQLSDKLRTAVVETQRLQETLKNAEQAAVPTDRLQHRLSPVTKPVDSNELHFRISKGRISQIPLDELLERLKAQVMSRRSTVIRFSQFEGSVGPVNGYSMTYMVEKEGPSTIESLQSGDGRTRVSVSKWTIEPDASLIDESYDEAIRPGSRFRQVIETATPDSVVTMWIYPDSFTGFSALREVAHGLQLRVAARPLPAGTPIVGSPGGSRSAAQ